MIEAVTFDLWQTLIRESTESGRKAREVRTRNLFLLLQDQGYPGTLEDVGAAYERVGERLREIWARHTDVGTEEQVRWLLEALDENWEPPRDRMALANLEWAYVSSVLTALPTLDPAAPDVLSNLKTRYRLGLICNTGRTPGAMLKIVLQRLGVLEYFDVLTFSDVIGVRKPDPHIFSLTLEQLGVSPGRALHVGDDAGADIVGARQVGMWAVHLGGLDAPPSTDARVRAIGTLAELPGILAQVTGRGEP